MATENQILYIKYLFNRYEQETKIPDIKNYDDVCKYIKYFKTEYNHFNFNEYHTFENLTNIKYNTKYISDLYIKGTQVFDDNIRNIDFIAFKNILMLDIDDKEKIDEICIILLLRYPTELFHIYETFNGYHVYCVSRFFKPRDIETIQLMELMKCDEMYIKFTFFYDMFNIRTSRKQNRRKEEKYVEKFYNKIGFGIEDSSIMKGMKKKDKLTCNRWFTYILNMFRY